MSAQQPHKLSVNDLDNLRRWIEKKCETLTKPDAGDNDSDSTYSEAKLTRGIFNLLLMIVDEKRSQMMFWDTSHYHHQHWQPPAHYYYSSPVTPSVSLPDYSTTICASCKASNPSCTHCIHRTTMQTSSTTKGSV